MKKAIRLTAFMLALISVLTSFVACDFGSQGDDTTATPSDNTTATPTIDTTEAAGETTMNMDNLEAQTLTFKEKSDLEKFKQIGRSVIVNNALCCDLAGSGIEFAGVFEGEVKLEILVEAKEENTCYFTVYVDGVRIEDEYDAQGNRTSGAFEVKAGAAKEVVLANFDKAGLHNIRIVKQTGVRFALAAFRKLSFKGYLTEKPADKELYIEFIGDSITSGQGTVGTNGYELPGKLKADYSDVTKSFSHYIAEEYGADLSVISESAIAVSGSYKSDGRTIFEHYYSYSYMRETAKNKYPYDFKNERVPDLVIIGLGTNEYELIKKNKTSVEQVKKEAERLIKFIRESYGEDVPIIWTYGMLNTGANIISCVKGVLDSLGGADAGLYYVPISGDSKGYSAHPSGAAHTNVANTIITYINRKGILSTK